MKNMLEITDSDIRKAEELFLPSGCFFDDERRKVVETLNTVDVLACAGSGKTTVLAAKLAILSTKLPFPDGRGICVLTHTNVAIKEVTTRLGVKGSLLLDYPNFFGTIQAFVDRFLAIPAYCHKFGKRPVRIDSEVFNEVVGRRFYYLGSAARYWIKQRHDPLEDLKSIRFCCDNLDVLVWELTGKAVFKNPGKALTDLLNFKRELLSQGILCYDDAYSLAFDYVRQNESKLRQVFSNRFRFVFIDEMQDTDVYQQRLLNKIFDKNEVIVQRIGDINQSIYNVVKEDVVWELEPKCLNLCGSKRFSCAIAEKMDTLSIQPMNMQGNPNIDSIKPKVLVFTDATIDRVLPTFGNIIEQCDLQNKCENKTYKAIGWVGKSHEQGYRTITSYWPGFMGVRKIKQSEHDTLIGYLKQGLNTQIAVDGANYYRKIFLRMFLKALRVSEVKDVQNDRNFSEKSFVDYLKKIVPDFYDELNVKMAEWSFKIQNGIDVSEEVKNFIICDFAKIFKFDCRKLDNFLELSNMKHLFVNATTVGEEQLNSERYMHSGDVIIDVATIHSVKGETHTATLYLETYYKGYDLSRILDNLCGVSCSPKSSKKSTMKMAYVGMTRPTHLLCIALHQTSINNHEDELNAQGWECIHV